MLFLICSSVIVIHILCYATHRHMKHHFQAAQTSTTFYGQQQRLTMMLIAQVSPVSLGQQSGYLGLLASYNDCDHLCLDNPCHN